MVKLLARSMLSWHYFYDFYDYLSIELYRLAYCVDIS